MKILNVVKTNYGAGWAFNQAKWLHEVGVEIVCVMPENSGGYAELYQNQGIEIIARDFSLPVTKPWLLPARIKDIRSVVEKVKPDIIHCHFVTNIMMVRIALKGTPNIKRVFQIPGPLHLESFFYRKAEILLSDENDYWLPSCKKTRQYYQDEGINEDRLFLCYYGGIDITSFKKSQRILRNQFSISDDTPLIGMVCYFYKPKYHMLQFRGIKGHEDFINAFRMVKGKHPEAKAICIGGAWEDAQQYEQKVIKYAKEKLGEDIIFTGTRSDIKDIYKELDIAVCPSHSENLGAAAESLGAAVPTVATNIGGFPDIVIDGETGYLCDAKNPKDLAKKLNKMLDNMDQANRMAQRGQVLVGELLDINRTAKAVLKAYKTILGDKNENVILP